MRLDPGGGEGQGEPCLEALEETVWPGSLRVGAGGGGLSWRPVSAGTAAVDGDPWRAGVRRRRGRCLGESPGILKDVS